MNSQGVVVVEASNVREAVGRPNGRVGHRVYLCSLPALSGMERQREPSTVNVIVPAGTVAADPVQRRMPSGDEVTELRLSVPEAAYSSAMAPHWPRDLPRSVPKRQGPTRT
jgi:hypothetical protein